MIIGNLPAWRAIPAAAAGGLQTAKDISDQAIEAAEQATAAAPDPASKATAKTAEEATKAAAAVAMATTISAAAGGADKHACTTPLPAPPHGVGVVIDGSATVLINNLPAARKGDHVLEPVGPPNTIVAGEDTVLIGDEGGGSGGGGGGGNGGNGGGNNGGGNGGGGSPGPAPGTSTQRVGPGTHWIEIELVNEAGAPVPAESYRIRLPDGREIRGRLDAEGKVRLEGMEEPGDGQVSFPDLDEHAWRRG